MLAGQFWIYSRNDGAVSFIRIQTILDEMTKRLSTAQRMHEPTPCREIDPKSTELLLNGLAMNEYVCYDETAIQTEYLQGDCQSGCTWLATSVFMAEAIAVTIMLWYSF
jgi:hypothetical protein